MTESPSWGDWQVIRNEIAEIFRRLEVLEKGDPEEDPDVRRNARHAIEKKSKP
jgi:hypothetical protein